MEHVLEGCQCEGKLCSVCQVVLCVGMFTRSRTTKRGLNYKCRVCASAKNKAWREANQEYNRKRGRDYHQAHKEQRHAKNKEWREKNREYDAMRHKAYKEANPERAKAANRRKARRRKETYVHHPRKHMSPDEKRESSRVRGLRYREANRARVNERSRRRNQRPENRERRREEYLLKRDEKRAIWRGYYYADREYHIPKSFAMDKR